MHTLLKNNVSNCDCDDWNITNDGTRDLKVVVSSTALAGILSLLTSLAGLPEVDATKEN